MELNSSNYIKFVVDLCQKVESEKYCLNEKKRCVMSMYRDTILSQYSPSSPEYSYLMGLEFNQVKDIIDLYFSFKIPKKRSKKRSCC